MTLETALRHARDTKQFEFGPVLNRLPQFIAEGFASIRCLIAADENTMNAAGDDVVNVLEQAGYEVLSPVVFPGSPEVEADYEQSVGIREALSSHAPDVVPVAVGSGTINDLVKVAAFELGLEYVVVATAASVDGYTSPGASLVRDGFKNSIYCRAPATVVADSGVIRSAPEEMSAAGYADLSSKLTAGSDWIIADAVGAEAVDATAWEMVQTDLRSWLAEPGLLTAPESQVLDRVMYGLTMTGLAMQYLRRSRPASGAEHLMSHIWEMRGHRHHGKAVSHGFQVAVGTLACTALTERVFDRDASDLDPDRAAGLWPAWDERRAVIERVFGPVGIADSVLAECEAKYLTTDALRTRIQELRGVWNELRERVRDQLLAYGELAERYEAAGCPTTPEEIGMSRETVLEAVPLAGLIRNRYTIVDLASEAGVLDECLEEIRSSGAYL